MFPRTSSRRSRTATALACALTVLPAVALHAWVTYGAKWGSRQMVYYVNPANLDVPQADAEAAIRAGADYHRSLELLRYELVATQTTVVRHLAADLPPVPMDRGKMEQVFINLFINALHAMSPGGKLTVATRAVPWSKDLASQAHLFRQFKLGDTLALTEERRRCAPGLLPTWGEPEGAPKVAPGPGSPPTSRFLALAYGLACYAVFFVTFLYAIGFLGNVVVPKSIDSAPVAPVGTSLAVNLLLLGVFAVQHSVMARQGFKRWWTRFVPKPVERSTYVLFSSLALILVFWQWRPMGGVVWDVRDPVSRAALLGIFALGWLTVLVTTFLYGVAEVFADSASGTLLPMLVQDVLRAAQQRLPRYKGVRRVYLVEELPRTTNGKVKRGELRAMLRQGRA